MTNLKELVISQTSMLFRAKLSSHCQGFKSPFINIACLRSLTNLQHLRISYFDFNSNKNFCDIIEILMSENFQSLKKLDIKKFSDISNNQKIILQNYLLHNLQL
jgi:hypothetical protein